MNKKLFAVVSSMGLLLAAIPVMADKGGVPNENSSHYAPDMEQAVDGVYDVEGRPDMKVKVFVHKEKDNAKPDAAPSLLVCGTDSDSSAAVGAAGWHLPATVVYRLNPSSVPSTVGSTNLAAIVNNSFGTWKTALASSSPTFSRGADTSVNRSRLDGQNVIAWGRTANGTLGVTYTWYYTTTGLVAETDTIMNNRVPWKWNGGTSSSCADNNYYDAQNIFTHEFGHWFGLDDEYDSAYVNNTMYGYGAKGEVQKDTLTTGDITGVKVLY